MDQGNALMRILHLCKKDISGGAARAAYRLHHGLTQQGITSQMLVQEKDSSDWAVTGPDSGWQRSVVRLRWYLDQFPLQRYPNRAETLFSPGWLPKNSAIHNKIQEIAPDVINLHWIDAGMMSARDIARIKQPIVWTLHDMWAFTGGCHYDQDCGAYEKQCGHCKVLASNKEVDLSRWVWRDKQKQWQNIQFTVVTPSRWLADCARKSSLFEHRSIEVIPYGLDTSLYRPFEKSFARQVFGLPLDKKLILFGALSATASLRKGFSELSFALPLVSGENIALAVFGSSSPQNAPNFGFETYYLGHLHDDYSLALLYSAADVFVLPSKEDNLPNMILEAMACGVPCVAFDIGGMPDMIDHQLNGYLVKPYDARDLAQGISWTLEDEDRRKILSQNARQKAEQEFGAELQAKRYLLIYEEIERPVATR